MENGMNTCRILAIFLSATLAGVALSQHALADPSPVVVSAATETTLQQGLDFVQKHEFRKALDLLWPLVEQGNPKAQAYIGEVYSQGGFGVSKDVGQAVTLFRKSADQGYARAQDDLGMAYANGQGVAKNEAQAVAWYRKAAEQGDAGAQDDLGIALAIGQGITRDERQAVTWFRKAADQGDARGQTDLGIAYDGGTGVAKDSTQALAWYRKAADQGFVDAQNILGNMYANGRGVATDEALAVAWFRKAAEQGNAEAQRDLGFMYGNGRGVAKDEAQAVAWYRKAAALGDAGAQYNLGLNYNNGEGVAKDAVQAMSWYRKAADQGYPNAQLNLGVMYAKGQGAQQNYAQAALWFALAAQQGNDIAVRNLELAVDKLPTLRMHASAPVRAHPEPTGTVVKTAAAGEVAYRLSQFDNWYEVYFRDRNIVGYINTSQASVVVADVPQPTTSPIRKTAYVEPASDFPAAPATRPGVTSCNTRCNNGQCLRTYDSGKHVAFQAEHKFNAFNNEWEWDAGSC